MACQNVNRGGMLDQEAVIIFRTRFTVGIEAERSIYCTNAFRPRRLIIPLPLPFTLFSGRIFFPLPQPISPLLEPFPPPQHPISQYRLVASITIRPDGDPNGTENTNNLRVCDLRDISPDGDVILLVGPESIRLRVSSHSLRAASPVFNVMFGPHWKEGQSLCASQPTEVRLEDDDADVMQLICCIIHHKNEDIPDAIEPRTALKLAIVVDKYDCATAMKYYLKQVLRPSGLAMETLSEQAYMVAAAFILQDDTLFRDLTRALLVEFKPCYTTLLEDAELRKHLPTEFFFLLSEKGSRTRVQLAQWPQQRLGKSCDCEANRARVEYYKSISKRLNSYRVTLLKIPIRHIINDLSRFSIKGIEDVSSCSLRCCKSIPDTGSKREIEVALSRTYVSISEVKNISGTKG